MGTTNTRLLKHNIYSLRLKRPLNFLQTKRVSDKDGAAVKHHQFDLRLNKSVKADSRFKHFSCPIPPFCAVPIDNCAQVELYYNSIF